MTEEWSDVKSRQLLELVRMLVSEFDPDPTSLRWGEERLLGLGLGLIEDEEPSERELTMTKVAAEVSRENSRRRDYITYMLAEVEVAVREKDLGWLKQAVEMADLADSGRVTDYEAAEIIRGRLKVKQPHEIRREQRDKESRELEAELRRQNEAR